MKIDLVDAQGVAPSVGPYSHAVTLDDLVFVSGNVGIDSKAQLVSSDVVDQTMQAFVNIRVVLEASGSKISDIMKTTVFLVDMNDYSAVNAAYATAMEGHAPARSCVAVAALPLGAKVEIEVIARKSA